jgi:hypothetical protein
MIVSAKITWSSGSGTDDGGIILQPFTREHEVIRYPDRLDVMPWKFDDLR